MEISDAMRLKILEDENRKLEGLVADLSLDNKIMRDLLEKYLMPKAKKAAATHVMSQFGRSKREACWLVNVFRTTNRCPAVEKNDQELRSNQLKTGNIDFEFLAFLKEKTMSFCVSEVSHIHLY
ncbi:MAG: hypothetical protein JW884_04140 [Deltaproteobacteria bacterium]|nr:hypothetical protein [Deltaproteobacteria bacterium]